VNQKSRTIYSSSSVRLINKLNFQLIWFMNQVQRINCRIESQTFFELVRFISTLTHAPSIEFGVVSEVFLEPLDWTLIHNFNPIFPSHSDVNFICSYALFCLYPQSLPTIVCCRRHMPTNRVRNRLGRPTRVYGLTYIGSGQAGLFI
jgi:hypothetical protein